MSSSPIIERAYQLARSGGCRTFTDIKVGLRSEGYANVDDQLYGHTLQQSLRQLCVSARDRSAPKPVPARVAESET